MELYDYLEKRGYKYPHKIEKIYKSNGIFSALCFVQFEDKQESIKQTDCLARAIIGWELEIKQSIKKCHSSI